MLAFIGHAFFLFLNAAQSLDVVVSRQSEVLARGGGEADSSLVAWADLRSWQDGRSQRVLLYRESRTCGADSRCW